MADELKNRTEPELARLMKAIADSVKAQLPPETLFAVIVFDDPGLGQYISNARRPEMIEALRETADRLEAGEDIPRSAP